MKPIVWIPVLVGLVCAVAGATTWSYHEFVTKEVHAEHIEAVKAEIAGVSINQRIIGSRDYIRYLEQEIRAIEREYGVDISKMPSRIREQYQKLLRELADERAYLQALRQKLK